MKNFLTGLSLMLVFTLLPATLIFANDMTPSTLVFVDGAEIVHKSDFDFTGITLLDDYDVNEFDKKNMLILI